MASFSFLRGFSPIILLSQVRSVFFFIFHYQLLFLCFKLKYWSFSMVIEFTDEHIEMLVHDRRQTGNNRFRVFFFDFKMIKTTTTTRTETNKWKKHLLYLELIMCWTDWFSNLMCFSSRFFVDANSFTSQFVHNYLLSHSTHQPNSPYIKSTRSSMNGYSSIFN